METINVSPLIFKALTLMAKRKEVSIEELTNEILTQGIKARVEQPKYITYEIDESEEDVYKPDPAEATELIQSFKESQEEVALGISYSKEEIIKWGKALIAQRDFKKASA